MTAPDAAIEAVATTETLLVALDFDGTLSPLVDEPLTARMTAGARAVVDELAALPRTTVALVSGRTLADLRVIAEHGDDSPIWLAGSHGAEFRMPGEQTTVSSDAAADTADETALRDRLTAEIARAVAEIPGVRIEPKQYGLGVHTRTADAGGAEAARAAADRLVQAQAPTWRRRTGHDILEYSFRHEGKDSAVRHLRERLGATGVLFAGDDVTDEDALASLEPGDLGVRVGGGETVAALTVSDIDGFVEVLETVARLRAAHTG
ncbi:trehalose-phosphatase [Microbacterium sp. CFBP 8790]|uniref:trehalose-phosphatase n=1 Tax=unclassified Microbacterium TaxID=2609290 RepID=UPI00178423C4|nr:MULTISPECIES: trehalose-phosphatase [unclassified Microbacterium]MBD8204963.1 trehalose-phosphatase [Microbacterium sp. CFBP 8801]MBD8509982.1 trehalose-phosphatase [Microbacterium sp. CFBP 8790]